MWNRRQLKKSARTCLKQNYIACIAVCFILAIFTSQHAASTSAIFNYDSSRETTAPVKNQMDPHSNWDSVSDFIEVFTEESVSDVPAMSAASEIFDSVTKSNSTVFKLLSSVTAFIGEHKVSVALIAVLSALLGFLYQIIIENLLIIGECRFFMENRIYHKTKISRIFLMFKYKHIIKPASIMFFKSLYMFLWGLTIIGFPIKYYQYYMIPYITAENPQIGRKEAFALSKEMMRGQKWRTFIFNMSFIGWDILATLTFGLSAIFFSAPYKTAANAELYIKLRRNAITRNLSGSENLNDPYIEYPPPESTFE